MRLTYRQVMEVFCRNDPGTRRHNEYDLDKSCVVVRGTVLSVYDRDAGYAPLSILHDDTIVINNNGWSDNLSSILINHFEIECPIFSDGTSRIALLHNGVRKLVYPFKNLRIDPFGCAVANIEWRRYLYRERSVPIKNIMGTTEGENRLAKIIAGTDEEDLVVYHPNRSDLEVGLVPTRRRGPSDFWPALVENPSAGLPTLRTPAEYARMQRTTEVLEGLFEDELEDEPAAITVPEIVSATFADYISTITSVRINDTDPETPF